MSKYYKYVKKWISGKKLNSSIVLNIFVINWNNKKNNIIIKCNCKLMIIKTGISLCIFAFKYGL